MGDGFDEAEPNGHRAIVLKCTRDRILSYHGTRAHHPLLMEHGGRHRAQLMAPALRKPCQHILRHKLLRRSSV